MYFLDAQKKSNNLPFKVNDIKSISQSFDLTPISANRGLEKLYTKAYPLNLTSKRNNSANKIKQSTYAERIPEYLYEYLSSNRKKNYKVKSKIDNRIIDKDQNKKIKKDIRSWEFSSEITKKKAHIPALSYDNYKIANEEDTFNQSFKCLSKLSKRINKNRGLSRGENTRERTEIEDDYEINSFRHLNTIKRIKKVRDCNNPQARLDEKLKKIRDIIKDPLVYDIN